MRPMDAVEIHDIDDPRIAPYRALKERELARQPGGRFIAEGEHVVRRLLASDFPVESVLLSHRRAAELAPLVRAGVPLYVAPEAMMQQVIGFKFHSGVIACGCRKPPATLEQVLTMHDRQDGLTLVILPEIANTENMGALIRVAAAFGANAMLLGERSCDPFFRQSIRVSMGTIFRLPMLQSQDLLRDLERLKREWGITLLAAVSDQTASRLSDVRREQRVGVLFGNEAQGLSDEYLRACDRRLTIPMQLGTDSLNVAVAAGVILYELTR
jgi:tRNA G18 (ribose-2'-O)-methylase SpoU